MGRLFVYLAIVSSVLGLVMLMPGSEPATVAPTSGSLMPVLLSGGGWVVGLTMGIALAWVTRLDWRSLPTRVARGARTMRHRVGGMGCGGVGASVRLFC